MKATASPHAYCERITMRIDANKFMRMGTHMNPDVYFDVNRLGQDTE